MFLTIGQYFQARGGERLSRCRPLLDFPGEPIRCPSAPYPTPVDISDLFNTVSHLRGVPLGAGIAVVPSILNSSPWAGAEGQ
ncbi:hypothetical protein V5799_011730, partial [Amblyomma americanum]